MATPQQGSKELVREIHIDAKPETVFAFFTDPKMHVRWMGTEATLDPTPGGVYRVNCTGSDTAAGQYVEVVPHSRLVLTWGWEGEGHPCPPGSSTVEFTFTPDGEGTLLRMVHRDLPDELVDGHGEGWDHFFERLVIAAPGGDAGPDPWVSVEAKAEADASTPRA